MAFGDYSTTPALNVSINGINIAEGCPMGNLNNALRQLAADGKALADTVSNLSGGITAAGGTFSGQIYKSGGGAFVYFASPSATTGAIHILPQGSALPAAVENSIVLFYA